LPRRLRLRERLVGLPLILRFGRRFALGVLLYLTQCHHLGLGLALSLLFGGTPGHGLRHLLLACGLGLTAASMSALSFASSASAFCRSCRAFSKSASA
jgi:hypothetical protein